MRNATQIYNLYRIWLVKYKHQGLSNRETGRILEVHHKTVAKWVAGIEPIKPQTCKRLTKESTRKRRARRTADKMVINHRKYGYSHTFKEISVIMELKPNEVKVVYLNAIRKIMIIMERRGIDIGLIPETLEDLRGQF